MQIALKKIAFFKKGSGAVLNPRGEVTDTTDLQASMRIGGQRTAIKVHALPDGTYGVVHGHRRTVAARALDWEFIDADIVDPGLDVLADMLACNVHEDVKPSRLGKALQELAVERKYTLERAAMVAGLKVDKAQLLIDLTIAPESVQRRVDSGEMSLSAWKALRDKPVAVQEQCAAMPKPTVTAVKQAVKQDARSGVLTDMLDSLNAENVLARDLNVVMMRLRAGWHGLSQGEKLRVQAIIEGFQEFIQEVDHATSDAA